MPCSSMLLNKRCSGNPVGHNVLCGEVGMHFLIRGDDISHHGRGEEGRADEYSVCGQYLCVLRGEGGYKCIHGLCS